MEHQHQPERSVSPVSPISPAVQPRLDTNPSRTQDDQLELEDHPTVPSTPPPAYLPGPPAYTPRAGPTDPEKAKRAKRSGHRKCSLFLLIATILFIIVIATVAGVAGAKAAAKNHKSSNPNGSGSSTDQVHANTTKPNPAETPSVPPVTSGNTGVAQNDCEDGSRYTTKMGDLLATFKLLCGVELQADGGSERVSNLNATTVYRFEDCMDACTLWNTNVQGEDTASCRAVTYNANLTAALGNGGEGNCYLKDSSSKSQIGTNDPLIASAQLMVPGKSMNGVDV